MVAYILASSTYLNTGCKVKTYHKMADIPFTLASRAQWGWRGYKVCGSAKPAAMAKIMIESGVHTFKLYDILDVKPINSRLAESRRKTYLNALGKGKG